MPHDMELPHRRWETQLPVDYLDVTLVQDAWETIVADLSEGAPAKIWYIIVEQTNNGAAVEDIELEITINGTVYLWDPAAVVSGARMYCYVTFQQTLGDFNTFEVNTLNTVGSAAGSVEHTIPFVAQSVELIRVRQTTAVDGVAAQIEVNIFWERKI